MSQASQSSTDNPVTYIQHHLQNNSVGEGFWTWNLDTLGFSIMLAGLLALVAYKVGRNLSFEKPGGVQNVLEVLVEFVNGDINQPVVIGRFYHGDDRPPLYKEDDALFEHRLPDGTLNHLRFANDGSIYLQREVTKPEDNTEAKASIKIDKNLLK